ncbi:MAG: histidine kinase dimerization/phospho-acceptor domain-containing protein, partial [Burkholderiales bacterium]
MDYLDISKGRIVRVDQSNALSKCHATSVVERGDSSIWVGCMDAQLIRIDVQTGAHFIWTPESKSSAALGGAIAPLFNDVNGVLWIAYGSAGLQMRDGSGRIIREFVCCGTASNQLPSEISQMADGPDGNPWLAGEGLYRWDRKSKRFELVPGGPTSSVIDFSYQTSERIWVALRDALEAYRWESGRLVRTHRVTRSHGLPLRGLGSVLADASGNVWVTTVQGLVHVDATTLAVKTLGADSGASTAEFDVLHGVITNSGLAFAPTMSNLVAFDTNKFTMPSAPPILTINEISIRRRDLTLAMNRNSRRMTLHSEDRDLRITARIHSLSSPNSRRYRFRLHGYDRDWVEDSEGERVFTRLEHGSYRLEVIASNADGIWSKPVQLEIVVLPAWWQTNEARLGFALAALLLVLAIAAVYRARLRRINATILLEQRRALAEQASAAKTRFLADLGHEIRTPMTGVLGMAELLHADDLEPRQRGRVEAIQGAGQQLLRLV